KLYGADMQFVEIELDPEESVIAEAGAMMMMEDQIEMETSFGDGAGKSSGLFGKLMGSAKRLFTRARTFMTVFKNTG
ncbi:AIM24 family protein, partial [Bacillus pseudomycoides]|uniref:AIM24 family protein n=1 Tax=Bacillus pseudomycoides TaxID=64104 RepID=UPI00283CFDE0